MAIAKLTGEHDLDEKAAENVIHYLTDQAMVADQVRDDRTIVMDRVHDEQGDWRVCCMTPTIVVGETARLLLAV